MVVDQLGSRKGVDTVFHPGIEPEIAVVGAEKLDDSHQAQGGKLGNGTAGLKGIELPERGIGKKLGKSGLDIDHLADDTALDEGQEMGPGGKMGGLAGFEQNDPALLGQTVEFFGFGTAEHKGDFAKHVLPGFEALPAIGVVARVGTGHIDAVDLIEEPAVGTGKGGEPVTTGKSGGGNGIGIVTGRKLQAADESGLGHKTAGNAPGADDTNPQLRTGLGTELGAGDTLGAGQIDDLAIFFQIVEMALPVAADGEDVDIVFLDVVDLLTEIVFDDNLIGITGGPDGFDALKHVVTDVELAALAVETVVGDTDNQVVAQGFGAPQKIEVPLMEQIVSAVGNDFLHGFPFTGSSCA